MVLDKVLIVEDEVHALLCCSTYERERRELYQNIQRYTNFDIKSMMSDKQAILNFWK